MAAQSIGLFEAKTHLSQLVSRAEQGEEVIITRHNRPVAKIVPFIGSAAPVSAKREALTALLQSAADRQLALDWKALRDEGRR